jgi:hypothetical protein
MDTVTLQDADDAARRAERERDRARQATDDAARRDAYKQAAMAHLKAGRILEYLATPPPEAYGIGLTLPASQGPTIFALGPG